jgi:diguanylate cyclase (GGDEF)-like protein/PAS domain S-box-containing protein
MTYAPPPAEAPWRDETRLAKILTWIATTVAFIVSMAGPGGYFWLSYEAALTESAVAARLQAALITQAITGSSTDWRHNVSDLIETAFAPSTLPETRAIHDATGVVVAQSGAAIAGPLVASAAPLMGPDGVVGEVVVTRSLSPILARTLVVAGITLTLGLTIYACLCVLPLRALRRTLEALKHEEAKAREVAEEHLRIVFEHAIEGIIVFTPEGTLESCNPAAQEMFGYPAGAMTGIPMTDLLQPLPGADRSDLFPTRQWETRAWRRDGTEFPVEITVSETRVARQHQRIGIVRDITERKQSEARLSYLANYDSLTGLPNRSLFRDRLERAMARAQRSGLQLAVMFLDLDRFKTINDSLGHDVGDLLLQKVATALAGCLRKTDSVAMNLCDDVETTVSRVGGDEFTVLVEGLPSTETATFVAQRILDTVARPFQVSKNELFISTSIGITLYPRDGADLDGLIKQADMAMYRAKDLGRNTYYFYSDELNAEAAERHTLEASLRHALAGNEFVLHYQPKADLVTGQMTGVEALLRWQPAGRKSVGPDKFIPILEDTGLIVPVGTWVLRQACAQMMSRRRAGLPPLNLAVNLSARQFRQQDLTSQVAAILQETGFEATHLELELTESMLMDDMEGGVRILAGLAAMGVRMAIDDFGTGHSSLAYLKRFSVHTLKIDRSFVRDTPDDPEDSAIAIAVIALANSLKLKVVAEGVETPAQMAFLRQQGCDEMQGYLLSRPQDARAFATWWRDRLDAAVHAPSAALFQ